MWINLKKPIIALAPMADMTDGPFCQICRKVAGKNFIIFREMVSAEAIVRDNIKTLKMCEFEKNERPIVMQIFGARPETMARAAKILVEKFQPDGIDINMGCPVPKIATKNFAGAALLKDHVRAVEIVQAVRAVVPKNISVSVKTRLGWGRDEEILEFAPKLEKAGADLITIHGRTKNQGYFGKANWEMIGRVKKILNIPVIANGDINSVEDIEKCLIVTSTDGVMIGRGALGNPWIFTKKERISLPERIKTVLQHAKLHLAHYGPNSIVTFRKHLLCYFKGEIGIKDLKILRQQLAQVKTLEELKKILKNI